MTAIDFQRQLVEMAGEDVNLELIINDNRSTMLSVRWEPDRTRISLHRMFLQAPQNIMQSLACYIRKEQKVIPSNIKYFIEDNVKNISATHLLNKEKLSTQGAVYNLQKIYNDLNHEYFDQQLNLSITWFGKLKNRPRSRVTVGLYQDSTKLIKIHRLLDSRVLPEYVVAFVIYHEMLHNVCPSYRDEKGIHRIHTKEFKQREVQFKDYQLAQQWIRDHYDYLFSR